MKEQQSLGSKDQARGKVEFRFDIRIIALSILFHLGVYAFLSLYTDSNINGANTVEVVITDGSKEKIFLPSKSSKKEVKREEPKTSKFFSQRTQRIEKETIAQNLGAFENQNVRKNTPQNRKTVQDSENGPKLLPSSAKESSQEDRMSSINFQVPNIAKGDFTFLNSDFSTYASFYNRITPKIIYNWGNNVDDIALFPHMREKLRRKLKWTTRIELILDKEGHYRNMIIINSSGSPELDHAVQAALENAAPYLNPPTGMIERDGTVHIMGEFTIYTHRPRLAY